MGNLFLAGSLAWLATLASLSGVDLEQAIAKYRDVCYKCQESPCKCREHRPQHE